MCFLGMSLAGTSGWSEDCIGRRDDCRIGVKEEGPGCEENLVREQPKGCKLVSFCQVLC